MHGCYKRATELCEEDGEFFKQYSDPKKRCASAQLPLANTVTEENRILKQERDSKPKGTWELGRVEQRVI